MFFKKQVPSNLSLRMQADLSLLTKWSVFLQNASGNCSNLLIPRK